MKKLALLPAILLVAAGQFDCFAATGKSKPERRGVKQGHRAKATAKQEVEAARLNLEPYGPGYITPPAVDPVHDFIHGKSNTLIWQTDPEATSYRRSKPIRAADEANPKFQIQPRDFIKGKTNRLGGYDAF